LELALALELALGLYDPMLDLYDPMIDAAATRGRTPRRGGPPLQESLY
jgi:hypothetical protein